jgi:transcriptional regulator with XRE-family HTH domain
MESPARRVKASPLRRPADPKPPLQLRRGRPLAASATDVPNTPEGALAGRLRRLRVELGWSQAMLAERLAAQGLDWHQTTVAKTESAERAIRYNEIVVLAETLGVSTEELLGLSVSVETLPTLDLKVRLQTLLRQEAIINDELGTAKQEMASLTEWQARLEARRKAVLKELPIIRRQYEKALSHDSAHVAGSD